LIEDVVMSRPMMGRDLRWNNTSESF